MYPYYNTLFLFTFVVLTHRSFSHLLGYYRTPGAPHCTTSQLSNRIATERTNQRPNFWDRYRVESESLLETLVPVPCQL